jgi:hypothetical protein
VDNQEKTGTSVETAASLPSYPQALRGFSLRTVLATLLLLSANLSLSGAQPSAIQTQTDLPKIFDTARYVYVQADDGDRLSGGITPYERQAIYNVEKQLRAWNRYTLTLSRKDADLVLVVHKSALGSSNVPVVVAPQRQPGRSPYPRDPSDPSDPSNSPQPGGPGLGAEAGSPDDELSVHILDGSGSLGAPIWHEAAKNGLSSPSMTLFKHLKQDVEEAYPH